MYPGITFSYTGDDAVAKKLTKLGLTKLREVEQFMQYQNLQQHKRVFDIAHGAGLAAIWGSWARYVLKQNPCRFAQLAVNVLNVPYSFGNDEKTALEGIAAMEDFFRSIGMPTSISDMEIELTDTQIKELAHKCSFMGRRTIGGFVTLNAADMENIYRMAR